MGRAQDEHWLAGDAYDAHRATDFHLFCTAAREDLGAQVPTCPAWDVTALCDHLARVYQGRSHVIATGAFLEQDAFVVREDGVDPVAFVQQWSDELDRSLLGLSDDAPTVTFMPGATTVHFWRRRMALETLVHRADVQRAVGDVSPMDDDLSADGVTEVLWFATHPEDDNADGIASTSVVALSDGAHRWSVELSDGAIAVPASSDVADVTVLGSAPALLLTVWGRDLEALGVDRLGLAPLRLEGDAAAYDRLLTRLSDD